MKKSTILCGALGLLALGLTACSSEKLGEPEKVTTDQTRFLAVQISAPNDGTRAFEAGAVNESYVNRLDFFFYDVNGDPTSKPQPMEDFDDNQFTDGPFEPVSEGSDNYNVTRIYKSVVPVELTQGMNLPAQVVCIVNGDASAITTLSTYTLAQLSNYVRDTFRNQNNYFVMSNSVYYGLDVLTGQEDARLCATPINANAQLFTTEQEAEDAITSPDATKLVDIYVERIAAKVGLTMAANAVQAYTLTDGDAKVTGDETVGTVDITFVPEFWAMNATAKKIYLTKRYGIDEGGVINNEPTYAQINKALATDGGFTNWNAPKQHRSYWGCSPSYYTNQYPDVSDQVNDLEDGSNEDVYSVNYWSYNDVMAEAAKTTIGKQALAANTSGDYAFQPSYTAGNATANGFIYTRETTVAMAKIRDIEGGNPAASVASAVLVGHYNVGTATTGKTFYVDRNAGGNGAIYRNYDNARLALQKRQNIVFTRTGNETDGYVYTPAGVDVFAVAHPNAAARESLGNIAGRLVTLQINPTVNLTTTALYYYDVNSTVGDGYERITTTNTPQVNSQLASVGYFEMFYNGLAFFSVPIRHLNFNESLYVDGQYKWEDMPVGALGVVRNHVYNLTINSVKGLGNGLRDDDQPIVPAKDAVNQYIAMKLNILQWNVANTWSVDL